MSTAILTDAAGVILLVSVLALMVAMSRDFSDPMDDDDFV